MSKYEANLTTEEPNEENEEAVLEKESVSVSETHDHIIIATTETSPPSQYKLVLDDQNQIKRISTKEYRHGKWDDTGSIRTPESNLPNIIKKSIEEIFNTQPWINQVDFEKTSNPFEY